MFGQNAPAKSAVPAAATAAAAQSNTMTGSFHGQVADQTGAVIPNATVAVTTPTGHTVATVKSDGLGSYTVPNLPAGSYIVIVNTEGFSPFTSKPISLTAGQVKRVDITLAIQMEQQQVIVTDETPTVSVSADANASTITIKGKDLDALSDDPDELSSELQALAGPSAGPNGGQIYIDGFTAGQLPPKSAIREIRINQNPFSPEYDKLGYGRIEILTKPGTDKFHGQALLLGGDKALNTGNPYTSIIPPYYSIQFSGSLSGPVTKNSSFFVSGDYRNIQNDTIINANYVAPTPLPNPPLVGNYPIFPAVNFNAGLFNPHKRINIAPRFDVQLGARNTLSVRYQYFDNTETDNLGSVFALPNVATNESEQEHQLQISDTQVISDRVVNETRFQYIHNPTLTTPVSNLPLLSVTSSFADGGASNQTTNDKQDRFEVQNYTQMQLTNHLIKFGARLRDSRISNTATSNFNGTFSFGARNCQAIAGCTVNGSATVPQGQTITGLQAYQITLQGQYLNESFQQIQQQGGGPTQLSYTTGNPQANASVFDAGLYVGDDWKARSNLSVSYGLRWETQNRISDHSDWAPRVSFAYGLSRGKAAPKTVIRGGYGLFYDRFSTTNVLQTVRFNPNGPLQSQTLISNPTCYFATRISAGLVANCTGASTSAPTSKPSYYQIAPSLHSPYTMQFGASVEQQLGKSSTFSATYLNSRGVHQAVTINANAPYMPGYTPSKGNLYEYFNEAVFKQNQLIATVNTRVGSTLTLSGFYTLSYANTDANTNPSNSANLSQDYGRAGFNSRNQLFAIATWAAPYGLRFSPFLLLQSGRPFNITQSQDVNGDSFFNDRPVFGTNPSSPTYIATTYGNFDTNQKSGGALIPVNYGDGPMHFVFNTRMSKTFGFGPRTAGARPAGDGGMGGPGGGDHRHGGPPGGGLGPGGLGGGGNRGGFSGDNSGRKFNLTMSVQALNLFNNISRGQPIGTVDGGRFGEIVSSQNGLGAQGAATRRIFLQAVFSF